MATYLLAHVALIALAIAGRDIEDTHVVVTYALLFFSIPAGWGVAAFLFALGSVLGFWLPGGLSGNLANVLLFGVAGYAQWFIFLPWVWRKVRVPSNSNSTRPPSAAGEQLR